LRCDSVLNSLDRVKVSVLDLNIVANNPDAAPTVTAQAGQDFESAPCKHCSLQIDADYNASLNHVVDLPEVPYALRKLQLNRGNGFLGRIRFL
jgi:hypothetical protein